MPNVSSMTCIAWLGLLGTVLALRSHHAEQDPSGGFECPTATKHKEHGNIFAIRASAFQDEHVWQDWKLYRFPNCSEEVGTATILPRLDQSDPEEKSEVSISIQDDMTGDVFLCSLGATKCVAHMRPPAATWMLVDLLAHVLSRDILQGFHSLRPDLAVLYELVVLFSCCILVVILFWSIGLIIETCREHRQRRWGLASTTDVSSKHLRLPSTTEIISQALIDVLCFIIGCGLFVLEGERFFRIYHDQDGIGFFLVIAFPLLFGCAAVMRIFLATSRCHLYYESLRSGMLLQLQPVTLLRDPLVLWFWLGLIITVANAAKVLFTNTSHWTDDLKALIVFVSPLYYMTSSLVDIQFAESIAVKQHCTLALEGISKDSPITLGADDSILPLQESTFVGLARERKVIQPPASPDREEASCSLNILDFQWVGFVALQRAQGLNRVLLRFFNPQLICALLCLGLFSFVVSFRTMTTTPHLLELRVIGAGLSKGFDPSLKEYALLTHSSQHLTGVAAKVNPSETSLLTFRTKSENRSVKTGAGLAEAIRLDQDVYPADVELEVQDTFRRTEYRLQVLKYGILPESVVFSGEHSNGRSFQRCVPWGYLSLNHEVRIPPGLKTMDIFINYDHFVIDLPAPKRAHDRFTNLYEENVSKEHCFQKQLKNKEVVKTQFSGAGCYSVVQPKWNSCAQTRADLTQKFLEQVKGAVHGDLCVQGEYLGDFDCKKLETSGSSQLSRKLTQKDSETPGPWWEDKQVELRLLLSVGSSQLVLLDSRSYTSRAQGIQLTTHPRDIMDLFKAYMMAGTTMVRHKNVWGSITDLFDRDFFGTLPDTKEADVAFILDDFPNLTSAEFLEIILVSHDMDCYIQGLKAEDGEELQLTKTNSAFCHDHASGPTSDSEACDGWQPTSSFALPVSAFKDKMRKAIAYSDWNSDYAVRRLVFKGHPVCTSLSTFEEEIPLGNIFISIELSLKPQIKPIAWMPGQKVQADTYPCKTSCDVEILNGDALRPSGLELFITIVNEEANCTMQDFKTKANQRIVNKSKISEEACSQLDILSSTKMCGGKFESTTIALSWVSDSEAVTWNNDRSLMKQKIKFNLTCSDRIWNPFPLSVDVNSYPDADVGKFLFKG